MNGTLVTDVWLGDPTDPPAERHADVLRAVWLIALTGLAAAAMTAWALAGFPPM
jgi:hypothetical protein